MLFRSSLSKRVDCFVTKLVIDSRRDVGVSMLILTVIRFTVQCAGSQFVGSRESAHTHTRFGISRLEMACAQAVQPPLSTLVLSYKLDGIVTLIVATHHHPSSALSLDTAIMSAPGIGNLSTLIKR